MSSLAWSPVSIAEIAKKQLQQAIEVIQGVQKRCVVCVLDEAHLLDKEMLEEFRFMLNYKFDSESPMALVLVGQTELWTKSLNLNPMQRSVSA